MARYISFVFSFILWPLTAMADQPHPWQLGFQKAATPVMEMLTDFHHMLLIIITGIVLLVFSLLIFVVLRFNKKANPIPSKTTHNTLIEIIWTAIPVILLVVIAIPSLKLLYYANRLKDQSMEMTIKAIGHQWYWEYQYPDHDNITFMSNMIQDADLKPGQLRLLDVDNRIVLPVGTNIRVLVTAADVLHSWAVPSFGVKKDAVPGRLNETWINIKQEGVYYGQCSELCGANHAYMPIAIEAVSKEKFAEWLVTAKQQFSN